MTMSLAVHLAMPNREHEHQLVQCAGCSHARRRRVDRDPFGRSTTRRTHGLLAQILGTEEWDAGIASELPDQGSDLVRTNLVV